jgi:N6-adenosine-specific RNA methylase IME4
MLAPATPARPNPDGAPRATRRARQKTVAQVNARGRQTSHPALHYDVMALPDIKKLAPWERPVSDLAADDCILFLWATAPKLQEALEVIAR